MPMLCQHGEPHLHCRRCYVLVPAAELKKLEEARVELYEYLGKRLTETQLLGIANATEQIWRVANTKQWPTNALTPKPALPGGTHEGGSHDRG